MKKLAFYGAIFAIVLGSAQHFFYSWSHNNLIVGLFAPINESVWEHMKLAVFPILIFSIIDYRYLKTKTKNFAFALMCQIYAPIVVILAIFYSYETILGHSNIFIDITSFVIAIVIARYLAYRLWTSKWHSEFAQEIGAFFVIALAILFVAFTFSPPRLGVFVDPNDNSAPDIMILN